ncbi:LysR family transcriptional regulator [Elstera litoralis]|uniref:LysR family transcriptional regulator n=1 Tax=Elstera litoralis TaxID=552518 RepID=A0A0F3IW88_9PROT|nr:LysR substrate-binding domain-containing protein [Elstera litoralis]KJV10892.1 LysR family transcriptional regulator [Elstera litoralis]
MKRSLPPLGALRAFEAAARHGRMILAAEELSVTPGAVSRQVRLLEEALGVALFEGPKSKPRLTDAGRALAPRLAGAFDELEAAVQAARAGQAAVLDISCLSTFLMRWLIPRLHRFTTAHPEIDVRLSAADGPVDPDRARFDGVITVEAEALLGPRFHPLFPEWLGPVAAPALADQVRTRGDLTRVPLLHTQTRPEAWPAWATLIGWRETRFDGPRYEHYYYTLEAASAGLGVCLAPWHLVAADVASGRLAAPLGFTRSGYHYGLRLKRQARAASEPFRLWLLEEAAAQPLPNEGQNG